jgi:hypothetical protein
MGETVDPRSLDEYEFGRRIHEVLFPAVPIQSEEFLFGRQNEIDRIRRALMAPGRQVFIYGERGVGKSSLANAAAIQWQSSDRDPLNTSCSSDASFASVVWSLIRMSGTEPANTRVDRSGATMKAGPVTLISNADVTTQAGAAPLDVEEAAERLDRAFAGYSSRTIAVVDEFDLLRDKADRQRFAELLKALGDRNSAAKLIFTGVAATLDELLESHASAHRQLDTVELHRLGFQARVDIVQRALRAFDVAAHDSVVYRIANVSNGFPYYVHLMAEHLLWAWYSDRSSETIEMPHLHEAFARAADAVHADLRRPYDRATRGRDQAAHVLWAVADAFDLERSTDAIWRSYSQIVETLEVDPIPRAKFSQQLRKLRSEASARVLDDDVPRGLHRYREAMVRGYVRMAAAKQNIQLEDQEYDAPPQMTAHSPRQSNRKRWMDINRYVPQVAFKPR